MHQGPTIERATFRLTCDGITHALTEPEAVRICAELTAQINANRSIHALILLKVCEFYKVTADEIMSHKRHQDLAWARQVAMWLCHVMMNDGCSKVGRYFGKDHGTALHAFQKVRDRMTTEPAVERDLKAIRERIEREITLKGIQ